MEYYVSSIPKKIVSSFVTKLSKYVTQQRNLQEYF